MTSGLVTSQNWLTSRMNEVRVPDEWPREKKMKFVLITLVVIVVLLSFGL
jgi:hypothetical protein